MSEKSDDLFRVKANKDGVELTVSKAAPGLVGRIIRPQRWSRKGHAAGAISDRLIEKISNDEEFDEADEEFANHALGDVEAKYVRLKRIVQRAKDIRDPLMLPADMSPGDVARLPADASASDPEIRPEDRVPTSQDWENRYREDASLVDDEMLGELYARILVQEDVGPGSVSLRTLGVLRYLDRNTAENFLKVVEVLIAGEFIPEQTIGKEALEAARLNHQMLLDLDDAGLVNAGAISQYTWPPKGQHVVGLPGQSKAVLVSGADGKEVGWSLKIHLLTPSGRQLARILPFEPNGEVLEALLRLIQKSAKDAKLFIADLPSPRWTGPLKDLIWKEWPGD